MRVRAKPPESRFTSKCQTCFFFKDYMCSNYTNKLYSLNYECRTHHYKFWKEDINIIEFIKEDEMLIGE
jgi:hypothetical protein